jgi:hypothetical protein
MITVAEAGRLGAVHTVQPGVLSLYLTVPLDPAGLRVLAARADELITAAESAVGGRAHAAAEDRTSIREKLEVSGRDWLGRTVAMFACADAGLFEVFPLPCRLTDRAVLGIRPHIRPLLAAAQRCPGYRIAVVEGGHAWLFHVAGEQTGTVTALAAATVPSPRLGGWDEAESCRAQQRAVRLAGHHYRETAATLDKVTADGEPEPLVIGGRDEDTRELFASLPRVLRERFAGSFAADARTLTAARVRELAAPLVAHWAEQRAERLAGEVMVTPPGGLAAIGLRACLAAVNACAVQTLIVTDDGLVPGYECGRCGDLSVDVCSCPDWGTAALAVPDVIEEMVARTLEDGGEVCTVHDGASQIAARLRFPVAR